MQIINRIKIKETARDYIQSINWLYYVTCRAVVDCLQYKVSYTSYVNELVELKCKKAYLDTLITNLLIKEQKNAIRWEINFEESEVIIYGIQ